MIARGTLRQTGSVTSEHDQALPASTRALLDAVTAISSDLDLQAVLTRIVGAATRLTDARYGALGVVGSGARRVECVPTGSHD